MSQVAKHPVPVKKCLPQQKSIFVNVATLFILSGTFFKLLKDYKARYMGIGKVDKDMALFYEDKKEKEKEEK